MTPLFPPSRLCDGDLMHGGPPGLQKRMSKRGRCGILQVALLGLVAGAPVLIWTTTPCQAAPQGAPKAGSKAETWVESTSQTPARLPPAGASGTPAAPAQPLSLALNQVLEQGMASSRKLVRADRQLARDRALTALNRAQLWPQLNLVGLGSYTQVGTSVNLLTNMPTLGDITLSLQQNDYAVLRNTFGNAGVVVDINLLPLGQLAELAASRSQEAASLASRSESERAARFELISTYRQLQLNQALVPVWQAALEASTAIDSDVKAIHRQGLAAKIDLMRAHALRQTDLQGLAEVRAQLLAQREQLATLLDLPPGTPLLACDPIVAQPQWPLTLKDSLERAVQGRPLLEALQRQQQGQRQQARAARALLYPSLKLVAGAGYSGNQLSVPVLQQGGRINGPIPLSLPNLEQSAGGSGSFYDWGAALLLRQPLWDGGRASASAAVAERQGDLLQADEDLSRQQIRQDVSRAWSSLQGSAAAISAAREVVQAEQRALGDARLRYQAQVDPLTELLLVQRDLQASRASLLTVLTRQALDWALLERETGEGLGARSPGT